MLPSSETTPSTSRKFFTALVTRMPITGLTSLKSRPNATVMCSPLGWQLFVGSKSTQPKFGQWTENHAWVASAPTSRGLPAGGKVRR